MSYTPLISYVIGGSPVQGGTNSVVGSGAPTSGTVTGDGAGTWLSDATSQTFTPNNPAFPYKVHLTAGFTYSNTGVGALDVTESDITIDSVVTKTGLVTEVAADADVVFAIDVLSAVVTGPGVITYDHIIPGAGDTDFTMVGTVDIEIQPE
jgi:hypothetical protein